MDLPVSRAQRMARTRNDQALGGEEDYFHSTPACARTPMEYLRKASREEACDGSSLICPNMTLFIHAVDEKTLSERQL